MSFLKKIAIFCVFLSISSVGWGKTYYIPHIHTANDSWETNLIADNLQNPDPQGFYLTLYGANGATVLDHQYYEVPANQSLTVSLRHFNGVDGEVLCGSNSLRLRLGYMAKESSGGGTAEFDLPSKLSNKVVFSTSNYYDQLTWSGFAVYNGSDSSVTANVTVMTTSGNASSQLTIPAKGKVVNYFDAQFGIPYGDINDVVFSADSRSLTGITISGKDNDKLLFTGTGSDKEGWQASPPEKYTEVHGIARAEGYALAFCYSSSGGSGYANIVIVRLNDGLSQDNSVSSGYENLYPLGIISDAGHTMAFAYGIADTNTTSPSYFVARVDPGTGTIMWMEKVSSAVLYPDLGVGRICAATDGTSTVEVNFRNASNTVETYTFRVDNGHYEYLSRSFQGIPTSITYDTVTGQYYSFFSKYNNTTQRYSTIALLQNTPGNLPGTLSTADFSALLGDGLNHHVLVYGGGVVGGQMSLIINVSTGASYPPGIVDPEDYWPTHFFTGSVSLSNFQANNISSGQTGVTGSMGDEIHIVKDEDNYVYAFCASPMSSWYGNTVILEFSDHIVWTIPAQIGAVSDDDMLLMGYQKYWFSGRPPVPVTKGAKPQSVQYNTNTYLERITFDDMMAKWCR